MTKQDTKTQAVRCAYLDLMGVLEAFNNGDPWLIDLRAVSLTLDELRSEEHTSELQSH